MNITIPIDYKFELVKDQTKWKNVKFKVVGYYDPDNGTDGIRSNGFKLGEQEIRFQNNNAKELLNCYMYSEKDCDNLKKNSKIWFK